MVYWNASMTLPGASPAASRSFSMRTRRTHARAGANRRTRDGFSVSETRLRRRRRHTAP